MPTLEAPDDLRHPVAHDAATPIAPAVHVALFGALAYAAGYNAVTLTLFSASTDFFFPWKTSALTAATLGAAYAGSLVMCLVALRARQWASVRALMPSIAVVLILVPLGSLLEHRALRLGGGPMIAFVGSYLWVLIHVALIACFAGALFIQRREYRSTETRVRHAMPSLLRVPQQLAGLCVVFAGAALVGFPDHAGWWPWRLAPIDARVLGALILAHGMGLLLGVREADLWRTTPGLANLATFGVLALVAFMRYPAEVIWDRELIYFAILALLCVPALVGLVLGGPWRERDF
jgi:hypothetical protein